LPDQRTELFKTHKVGGAGMGGIGVKKNFIDEQGKRVMEIDVLPSKHCTFECVFCPIRQKGKKTDKAHFFDETKEFILFLEKELEYNPPDVLFINSKGEAFLNAQLGEIIKLAKSRGVEVSLYTNGYLLDYPDFAEVAAMCDEVAGEIKTTKEEDFKKFQRPLDGYTLKQYWANMMAFRSQYSGKFVVYVTLIKNLNVDQESISQIRNIIKKLEPHKVIVETFKDERFGKVFGVSEEELGKLCELILE
jgi:wyosine [tRNA(Phe)-imidazoG37] synthetase (radical SAM superfamily)